MKEIKALEFWSHGVLVIIGLFLLNYPPFDLSLGVFSSGNLSLLWPSIIGTAINLILFYTIIVYLVPEILKKRNTKTFTSHLLLLFLILSLIEIGIDGLFVLNEERKLTNAVWFEIILIVVMIHTLTTVIALMYRFAKDWFTNEKLRRTVNEWQLRTELDMLKGQINPHFLFNALNNLFSMSLKHGDEKTAEGISKLSEMMRYVFDRSSQEKVALQDEISYIEDYIYLQKLRFEKKVKVSFIYPKNQLTKTIAPMLLIPFVENAFKYGVSGRKKTNINIAINITDTRLEFSLNNEIVNEDEKKSSTGIGIKNVRKRLALIYPDRHDLSISIHNNQFEVILTIEQL